MAQNQQRSAKPQKLVVKCRNCQWSTLVQYRKDPVLAECAMKEPHEREIADTVKTCPLFIEANCPKNVIQR